MLTWIKRIVAGLVALVLVALLVIYGGSHLIINKTYAAQKRSVLLTSRPEVLAEGERKAQVFGCYRGCHGRHMEGDVAWEDPGFGRVVGPSLLDAVRRDSTAELEASIRQGVKPDGKSTWAMPSASFATMTDKDLAAILSFIRDYPAHESENDPGKTSFALFGRIAILTGMFKAEAPAAARYVPSDDRVYDDPLRLGEYMVMNTCSECHGLDLNGFGSFTPSLQIAKAYDRSQFRQLLAEGTGLGGRDVGLMSEVAKMRFSLLNDAEVDAMFAWLRQHQF